MVVVVPLTVAALKFARRSFTLLMALAASASLLCP